MTFKCPICSKEFSNSGEFEHHLNKFHIMSYGTFSEIMISTVRDEDCYCYRCKTYQNPLTYVLPDQYYLPCSCVLNKKTDKTNLVRSIFDNNLKDYLDRIIGDRYFQLFLSNLEYFDNTLPHSYSEFKSILSLLELPNRNEYWYLEWKPGYPKVLSKLNLEGIDIINCTDKYSISFESGKFIINDLTIHLPELVSYDAKHHSRYNILNRGSDRKTKRLKLGSTECVKFYNAKDPNNEVKSIFQITRGGEVINFTDLAKRDKAIIPLVLFRNKTVLRLIFEILIEISKSVNKFKDEVFLKNSIEIGTNKSTNLNFFWHTIGRELESNCINLSLF